MRLTTITFSYPQLLQQDLQPPVRAEARNARHSWWLEPLGTNRFIQLICLPIHHATSLYGSAGADSNTRESDDLVLDLNSLFPST
jgi:hypothetical protein